MTTNYKGLEQHQKNEWITSAWEADTLNTINVMIQAHSSILHFFCPVECDILAHGKDNVRA